MQSNTTNSMQIEYHYKIDAIVQSYTKSMQINTTNSMQV